MLFNASVEINSVFGLNTPFVSSSNSYAFKLFIDQMQIFLSAPVERMKLFVMFILAGLE